MKAEQIVRRRFHQCRGALACFTQPEGPVFGRQNDGHAMMDGGHRRVGGCGDDGAGDQRVFALVPGLINTREGQSVGPKDVPGQAVAVFVLGPFIEATCRDQAAPFAGGGFEGGLFGNRFAPRVDQQGAAIGGLVPVWQKSPSHGAQASQAVFAGHRVHLIGGAHVIVRHVWQIVGGLRLEKPGHRVVGQGYGKSSAHIWEYNRPDAWRRGPDCGGCRRFVTGQIAMGNFAQDATGTRC